MLLSRTYKMNNEESRRKEEKKRCKTNVKKANLSKSVKFSFGCTKLRVEAKWCIKENLSLLKLYRAKKLLRGVFY
ncbi:unnamed protein product [Blepharisma stoltei]|uniref:Uncharacterized protein n=1 Tax=Blepharisma stoltei TaxID=1481888 RepID=A0AAU9JZU1_9CILI|nr:unnamed protein product [Blepharisma stoltei]